MLFKYSQHQLLENRCCPCYECLHTCQNPSLQSLFLCIPPPFLPFSLPTTFFSPNSSPPSRSELAQPSSSPTTSTLCDRPTLSLPHHTLPLLTKQQNHCAHHHTVQIACNLLTVHTLPQPDLHPTTVTSLPTLASQPP